VSAPRLSVVPLEAGDVAALLAQLPTQAGVAQVLGPDGQSLLIGRPANLRRWAATQLGSGPPPKRGMRPPTNLAPITSAVAFAATTTPFAQRLAFERVMGRHVPISKRRDLKPPLYLHLDPAARFPRLTVRPAADERTHLYGPFRSRAAAQSAIEALHALFPLRPCDYAFEPASDLALGLGCVFAQVRTCAAPCLQRIGEDDYRALAARAASALGAGTERPPELAAAVPPWVGPIAEARGVVADRAGATLELYPVVAGAVMEEAMAFATKDGLEEAVAALRWSPPPEPRDDMPWLVPWLHGKRTGTYVDVAPGETAAAIAARLRG
jgi:DNA polymerase III subunit epsilon